MTKEMLPIMDLYNNPFRSNVVVLQYDDINISSSYKINQFGAIELTLSESTKPIHKLFNERIIRHNSYII